jgi:hypothetical protein
MLGEGEAETGVTNGFERLWEEEDTLLVEDGFEPVGSNLWMKDGVYYGKKTAPQAAWST